MLLRSAHQAQGLRVLSALAHHRSQTLHTDLSTLATSTDALYDACVNLLTDMLHLCQAADIDAGEAMGHASDRYDDQLSNDDGCQLCGNLLDDDEDHICGPCVDRAEEDTSRTSMHTN